MKTKLTREKELETILAICIVLVVAFFIIRQPHYLLLYLSILIGLTGMFSKLLTSKIVWGWLKLSEVFASISSKIILTIVFFCFLWPVAVLSRMFGNKSNLRLDKSEGASYFISRNHKDEPSDLENGW